MHKPLTLRLLPEEYAVCRMDANAPIPAWAMLPHTHFASTTRTADELSVVVPMRNIPVSADEDPDILVEGDYRAFMVQGPLDFSLTGILASLTVLLANAEIPVFAISTYDTDYLFVEKHDAQKAMRLWRAQGDVVEE